jgi:hypothetical protein
MWTGYAGLMRSAADLPQAQQGIEDFMRTGAVQLLAIPGVPQHVLGRAYAATAAVGEIAAISSPRLPAAGEIAEAIKRAATAFDSLPQRFDERLNDAAVPVAIRRMERKALRGMVAIMLVGTLDVETDSDLRAELLAIYAEGMESLVYFVALDLDDEHTPAVDNIIKGLRLAPLDRTTLRERAALLERAHAALDSSADHLDGERLQLPPDPGFRAPPNS